MRLLPVALAAFVVAGVGCRELTVPERPGPGSVTGRVLLAEPGEAERKPAAGAEVRLLGSGQATTTTPAGTFTLQPVAVTQGLMLVRVTVGQVVRQRVLQLSDYGTGPGKNVSLGDIVVGENARVRGKVLRGDLAGQRGGHGGTAVFVPAGPFTAYTNDDGSFTIDQMPEGPVELYVFRTGYAPLALASLSLRAGETVELRDVSLEPAATSAPGAVSGKLAFDPPAAGVGDTRVRLTSTEGASVDVPVAEDLSFKAQAVPVGLYRLIATRSGYSQLDVINVLVVAEREARIGTLTLTTAPAFDAGPPVVYDAGPPDAGPPDAGPPDAGPPDAGPPDAGPPDAGPQDAGVVDGGRSCTVQADCSMGEWCDRNRCVPLCVTDPECGFGRVCQQSTRTCVQSCVGQCPAGQICTAQNVCQAVCDGTFPCPSGQRCSLGACVPECVVNADCNSPFLSCDLGICKRNSTCLTDLDCAREAMCVSGQCGARPTDAGVRSDGGTWPDGGQLFACSQACHCRLGEICSDGFCAPDEVPTRFVALDAGGDGRTAATPTGDLLGAAADGGVIALLAQDTWLVGAVTLRPANGSSLLGGYTACSPTRWVRDQAARTVISGEGPTTFGSGFIKIDAPVNAPYSSLRLAGLSVRGTGVNRCAQPYVHFLRVNGLTVEDVDFDLQTGTCGNFSGRTYGLRVEAATGVTLRRLRLLGSTPSGDTPWAWIGLNDAAGLVEDLTSAAVALADEARTVEVLAPRGPVTVRRLSLGGLSSAAGSAGVRQVHASACGAVPFVLEDATLAFPSSSTPGQNGVGVVSVTACNDVTVRRVRVHANGHPGGLFNNNIAVELSNSGGVAEDLDLVVPPATGTVRTVGLDVGGQRVSWTLSRVKLRSSGGTNSSDINNTGMVGVELHGGVQGPLSLDHFDVELRDHSSPIGLWVYQMNSGAQLSVVDSSFVVDGDGTCQRDTAAARVDGPVRLERNVLRAGDGAFAVGLRLLGAATETQLFGNSVQVGFSNGTTTCRSGQVNNWGSHAVAMEPGSRLLAVGNTFDPAGQAGQAAPTVGLSCFTSGPLTGLLGFRSNIVTSGRGTDARLFAHAAGYGFACNDPSAVTANYFVHSVSPTVSAAEHLFDGGFLLDGGNRYGGTSSCFAPPVLLGDGGLGFPHLLTPSGPCKDLGAVGQRLDGSPATLDLFGRPRDGGAGPDVGAVEGD